MMSSLGSIDGAADSLARLERSGLCGRGGGWFPAARKWRAVRAEGGDPVVVANGAESEPGSIKDRYLMLTRSDDVVSGTLAASRALGAREAILYVKGTFRRGAERLREAVRRAAGAGVTLRVYEGEDGYVAGEETALLESLEGRRAWPRPKPPLPAAVGLHGRPTLVQNVETLLRVPSALSDPAGYERTETTYVSLWGAVQRPGVYEVPLGLPVARVVNEAGGVKGRIGFVFPGGPSAPPLTAAQLETPLAPGPLREAGSGLGAAAVLVVSDAHCPIAVGASLAAFFEREACGQCPPCTVGTARLSEILRRLEAGEARGRDLASFAEAAGFMSDHGYCAHSRTAAAALRGLLGRVPDDVRAHLEAGSCPHPGPAFDPFAPGSPERASIEAVLEAVP